MKDINNYILEKLVINKDSNADRDYKFYYECDIDNVNLDITVKDIDETLAHIGKPRYVVPTRKAGSKNEQNRFWYAIYCYLYDVGPKTIKEIRTMLKPNNPTSLYSELFADMRYLNIIRSGTGKDKGLQFPNPPEKWITKHK